jgi:hypothetical protein
MGTKSGEFCHDKLRTLTLSRSLHRSLHKSICFFFAQHQQIFVGPVGCNSHFQGRLQRGHGLSKNLGLVRTAPESSPAYLFVDVIFSGVHVDHICSIQGSSFHERGVDINYSPGQAFRIVHPAGWRISAAEKTGHPVFQFLNTGPSMRAREERLAN